MVNIKFNKEHIIIFIRKDLYPLYRDIVSHDKAIFEQEKGGLFVARITCKQYKELPRFFKEGITLDLSSTSLEDWFLASKDADALYKRLAHAVHPDQGGDTELYMALVAAYMRSRPGS